MKLENDNDQLMTIAAFRYCLGRQSYIVGSCLDWLYATWDQIETNTRFVIVRDTLEAIKTDRAGSETIDKPGWEKFAKWAFETLPVDHQSRIRQIEESR